MHETYRILAENRIEERLREAAAWRRAAEARAARRRSRLPTLAARLRALRLLDRDQPVPVAPPAPAAACDAASRA